MKEFVDNNYGRRKAEFFRDQVVSNAKAAMIKTRDEAISNPEIFADTPMAWNGTQVYNGMKSGDILAMYDKKQNAYDSINPFESLVTNFSETTKYFTDPRYFSHRQTAYINPKFMDGLGEDDIANAFIRKGINADMARGLSYDYFNPQQTTDTTDYTTMSREDKKAMRKSERNEYKKMLNDQKDWFSGAFNLGAINPSYSCGGIKKMAHGGPLLAYVDRFGNQYMTNGYIYKAKYNGYDVHRYIGNWNPYKLSKVIEDDLSNNYNYDSQWASIKSLQDKYSSPHTEDASSVPTTDTQVITDNEQQTKSTTPIKTSSATSGNKTSTQPVVTINPQSTQSQNTDVVVQDNQIETGDVSNDQSAVEKLIKSNQVGDGRSFINISTPWGHGKVYLDNNNIDVRRNGRRLAIWGDRNPSTYRVNDNYAPIKDYSYIPQDSKEITVPDNTSGVFYNTNNYWGSMPTVSYSNPLGNMRCGGVTKAALGMALINDEKYDNGNIPNIPIGQVNPVSWEPIMTVDTTPSKEESTPQGSSMDSIADQADAATGIKNKNDYGYGISQAAWNGLMFAGNFAEKMRNDKNQLASVAARLNNTQDSQVAMRGYDPTVNPTHLGYDADPSRLSQLYTYKCGGRKYALGGVYDLTAKEIDEILNNGGKIEYLW